ncbi:hypothetical protein ABG768_027934 [Culter alburnus]|uniref:Uncharacterized protein n=1 Tax=Culter alburnus TaxID=194366 RepID=A0AAW2AB47_CULAL
MDFKSIALTSRPRLRLPAGHTFCWLDVGGTEHRRASATNPAEGWRRQKGARRRLCLTEKPCRDPDSNRGCCGHNAEY